MPVMTRIYVDHAATTPLHPQVKEVMMPFFDSHFGNPSSIHSFGREMKSELQAARQTMANCLGGKANEWMFTSGGTESDNTAIMGLALARGEQHGKHIVTSQVEHHAVLHTCAQLEQMGFEITYLPVDHYGHVQVEDVRNALRPDTILVTIMYGNNEVGTLQSIEEIGHCVHEHGIPLHTDAVQALGVVSLNVDRLPVDMVSISSHKINGPKGVGGLYVSSGIQLQPLLFGGNQERGRRAGTENMSGIIGFAKAVELAEQDRDKKRDLYAECRRTLLETLDRTQIDYQINGLSEQGLPHIVNLSFQDVQADALLMNLDLAGIAVSSGSACTAGSLQPSHVIQAMYADQARSTSAIRFSFGLGNTPTEIETVATEITRIIGRMKKRD